MLGATRVAKGATFDAFLVCDSLMRAAQESHGHPRECAVEAPLPRERAGARGRQTRGVQLLDRVEVLRVERGGGGTAGAPWRVLVVPSGGAGAGAALEEEAAEAIEADEVVLAAGWLAGRLAGVLGHALAVQGVQGRMFAMHAPGVALRHNVFAWESPHFWATHPELGHQCTLDPDDPTTRLTRHLYGLQISNGTLKVPRPPARRAPAWLARFPRLRAQLWSRGCEPQSPRST